MPEDRFTTQVRLHRSVKRGVDEYAGLRELSAQGAVELLIQEGLGAEFKRLGIEKDPVTMTRDLLRIISSSWGSDLADEEITAFGITQNALDRLASIRSRESR